MKELELIFKNIKNKEFLPIYFFHGEEAYYIDIAVKALENDVLTEDEKAFNQTVVYGKDTNYNEILSLAKQYPMMGDKQLIIVKEAQDLKFNDEETKILEKYVENPVESTILVFASASSCTLAKYFLNSSKPCSIFSACICCSGIFINSRA